MVADTHVSNTETSATGSPERPSSDRPLRDGPSSDAGLSADQVADVRPRSLAACVVAYVIAGTAAVAAGLMWGSTPLVVAGVADVVATLVIFGFSVAYDNSSFYDPYWSIAPIVLAGYWIASAQSPDLSPLRQGIVAFLVGAWGLRLTFNWLRGWAGLSHEDWRYVDLREKCGRAYWLVSLLGIHLFPTVMVFLACGSLYVALSVGTNAFGALDVLACLVTGFAIWCEATADRQLLEFRRRAAKGETLTSGLWAYTRHPNYLGENLFWWGMYLFALAAEPSLWWVVGGPAAITLMFLGVSIPMIDKRSLERRPEYGLVVERIPALWPRLPR